MRIDPLLTSPLPFPRASELVAILFVIGQPATTGHHFHRHVQFTHGVSAYVPVICIMLRGGIYARFILVFSYVGDFGNEASDRAAKLALRVRQ